MALNLTKGAFPEHWSRIGGEIVFGGLFVLILEHYKELQKWTMHNFLHAAYKKYIKYYCTIAKRMVN